MLETCKEAAGWPRKEEEGDDEAVQVKSHLTLPKDTVRDCSKDDPKKHPLTGTVIKLMSVLKEKEHRCRTLVWEGKGKMNR